MLQFHCRSTHQMPYWFLNLMHAHALELFICSVQKFLFAACKSFYLQRAKVFICSVQKFLFAACKSFHLQRATVLLAACKRFYWQCGKVFIGSVQKFLLAVCICYLSIQEYRIIIYLLRDILIVCKFHIINSIAAFLSYEGAVPSVPP